MIYYSYTILMYCYILKPMNLIECVTSINDHIINLNYIFYYVFQQNIHDFHEFQGGGWVDVCIGWVFKMMCMRSGRGM